MGIKVALVTVSVISLFIAIACNSEDDFVVPKIPPTALVPTEVPESTKSVVPTISPTYTPEISKPTWEECRPHVIDFYRAVQYHRISLTKHRQYIVHVAENINTESDNKEIIQNLGESLIDHHTELQFLTDNIIQIADNTPHECKILYYQEIERIAELTYSELTARCRGLDSQALNYIPESELNKYANKMLDAIDLLHDRNMDLHEGYKVIGDVILTNYQGLLKGAKLGSIALCSSSEWNLAILELEDTMQFGGEDSNDHQGA